nr:MAG TPA: hypothetical protein [Caudoviricetes sp.]
MRLCMVKFKTIKNIWQKEKIKEKPLVRDASGAFSFRLIPIDSE